LKTGSPNLSASDSPSFLSKFKVKKFDQDGELQDAMRVEESCKEAGRHRHQIDQKELGNWMEQQYQVGWSKGWME
jgi:hypothetical protein